MLLKENLSQIPGYTFIRHSVLSEPQIAMLNLDDYFYANYKGINGNSNLYIGYYYSANKAYAAHSPLICYPSQGWKIESSPKHMQMQIGEEIINYNEIITTFGDKKELVLYWYQSGTKTNRTIYRNKISMGYNKLRYNFEQHAFVRVALPMENSYQEAQLTANNFINAFYPKFVNFIQSDIIKKQAIIK